jgi:UrcA family protein
MLTTTSNNVSPRRVAVFAGCLLSAAFGLAQAATPADEAPSVVVRYGDLNLATEAGTNALYSRIVAAARQVCPQADQKDLTAFHLSKVCQANAIARAVQEVHSPQLAAAYTARSRRG